MQRGLERRFQPWLEVVGDLLLREHCEFPVGVLQDQLHATFDTQVGWNWANGDGSFGFRMHPAIDGWPSPEHMEFWAAESLGCTRSCAGSPPQGT